MKLFLIIYLGAKIVGVTDPLPHDQATCLDHKKSIEEDMAVILDTGKNRLGEVVTEPHLSRFKQMRFECEYHTERPTIEGKTRRVR